MTRMLTAMQQDRMDRDQINRFREAAREFREEAGMANAPLAASPPDGALETTLLGPRCCPSPGGRRRSTRRRPRAGRHRTAGLADSFSLRELGSRKWPPVPPSVES